LFASFAGVLLHFGQTEVKKKKRNKMVKEMRR